MGQQQLLLLVLAGIIVGIAAVVGISMFTAGSNNANRNAVQNACATIAAQAKSWYDTPLYLGGGDSSFVGITMQSIGAPDSTGDGTYSITGTATNFTIQATGTSDADKDGLLFQVTVVGNNTGVTSVTVNEE